MNILTTSFSKPGKRENNEDAVYPYPNSGPAAVEGLFIVCDGVGGANKGEVASHITVNSIVDYFASQVAATDAHPAENINAAVTIAGKAMARHRAQHAESEGMATTLAMLRIAENMAIIAHVGDSRVYHIRNGKIVSRTKDHSLVQELVDGQFITEEQAKSHPKRNVITRAISEDSDVVRADTTLIRDIYDNDCFFLCSDGILESMSDEMIGELFTYERLQNGVLWDIEREIDDICSISSNDNYSAVIVHVKDIKTIKHENVASVDPRPFYQNENILIALMVILAVTDLYLLFSRYYHHR